MNMHPDVLKAFQNLGGSYPTETASLQEFLLGTSFPYHLYNISHGDGIHGVDTYFAENRAIYDENPDKFMSEIEAYYFSKHDDAHSQDFWKLELFTPQTPGTADFKSWNDWLVDNSDLSPVHEICGDGPLEFVKIIYSYGFPDEFYICLQDPNPENPTVFGTDHEVFFQEIDPYGNLATFLQNYCTREKFREIVLETIEKEKKK